MAAQRKLFLWPRSENFENLVLKSKSIFRKNIHNFGKSMFFDRAQIHNLKNLVFF